MTSDHRTPDPGAAIPPQSFPPIVRVEVKKHAGGSAGYFDAYLLKLNAAGDDLEIDTDVVIRVHCAMQQGFCKGPVYAAADFDPPQIGDRCYAIQAPDLARWEVFRMWEWHAEAVFAADLAKPGEGFDAYMANGDQTPADKVDLSEDIDRRYHGVFFPKVEDGQPGTLALAQWNPRHERAELIASQATVVFFAVAQATIPQDAAGNVLLYGLNADRDQIVSLGLTVSAWNFIAPGGVTAGERLFVFYSPGQDFWGVGNGSGSWANWHTSP